RVSADGVRGADDDRGAADHPLPGHAQRRHARRRDGVDSRTMSDVKLAREGADDRVAKPRRRIQRIARGLGLAVALVIATLLAATLATARWGDAMLWPPPPGEPPGESLVVNHGYHSGVVRPRRALADQASRRGLSALGMVATRFADFERLEFGWGEEAFYRQVPTVGSVTAPLALRALL